MERRICSFTRTADRLNPSARDRDVLVSLRLPFTEGKEGASRSPASPTSITGSYANATAIVLIWVLYVCDVYQEKLANSIDRASIGNRQ